MFDEILEALQAYTLGEVTKGGFSRLELLLARAKQDTHFDSLKFDKILADLVSMEDASNEDFAMGIALIANKTGSFGSSLRDELERKLFSSNDSLSARSQFELASLYIACDGVFAPQNLKHLTKLRSEIPELWLDLAFDAYPSDTNGLQAVIIALIKDDFNPLDWSSLKPRYLKLIKAVTNQKFNGFVLAVAAQLNFEEQSLFLDWVNMKRGSQLSLPNGNTADSAIANPLIQQSDIDFVADRPPLARPVLEAVAA